MPTIDVKPTAEKTDLTSDPATKPEGEVKPSPLTDESTSAAERQPEIIVDPQQ